MEDEKTQILKYCESIGDYFIAKSKWKGNIISYSAFVAVYELLEISRYLESETAVSKLINFLQVANVQMNSSLEKQNVERIQAEI